MELLHKAIKYSISTCTRNFINDDSELPMLVYGEDKDKDDKKKSKKTINE